LQLQQKKNNSKERWWRKGRRKEDDVNENDIDKGHTTNEPQAIEREKTMSEREKTTVSLQDAEQVKE
jgi:hypothetical protein